MEGVARTRPLEVTPRAGPVRFRRPPAREDLLKEGATRPKFAGELRRAAAGRVWVRSRRPLC